MLAIGELHTIKARASGSGKPSTAFDGAPSIRRIKVVIALTCFAEMDLRY